MDKEEILARSRKENRDRDLYKQEIEARASSVGVLAATALATIFFVVQLIIGGGANFGLYALLFSVGAAQFTVKAVYLKRRREVLLAVLYTAITLALSVAYIFSLVALQGAR